MHIEVVFPRTHLVLLIKLPKKKKMGREILLSQSSVYHANTNSDSSTDVKKKKNLSTVVNTYGEVSRRVLDQLGL